MSFNDRSFAYAQIAYIFAVAIELLIFPGASFWPTLIAMGGVWIAAALCYQATAARNSAGWWALLAVTTLLSAGAIANIHFFTTAQGATTSNPVLFNVDARANFDTALSILGLGEPAHAPRSIGYPMLIAGIWRITGITVVAPIVLNMLMILLTIIVSGTIAVRATASGKARHSQQWIQTCAMIMTASICYMLNTGTILLKDAGICLSMAMAALGLTSLIIPPATPAATARLRGALAIGIIGTAIFRLNYIFMILVATIVITPWARNDRRTLIRSAIVIGATALTWVIFNWVLTDIWNPTATGIRFYPDELTGYFTSGTHSQHMYHDRLLSGYYHAPIWYRLLWLPANAVTLYLIPFPWDFSTYTEFGYTYAVAKFSYPWYAVGALVIYYMIYLRRGSSPVIRRLTYAAILLWLVPAYFTAGSVSRYILPLIVWLIPAAVTTLDSHIGTRRFRIYAATYCALLGAALIVCHHLQHSAIC